MEEFKEDRRKYQLAKEKLGKLNQERYLVRHAQILTDRKIEQFLREERITALMPEHPLNLKKTAIEQKLAASDQLISAAKAELLTAR